jgi:glycosyltransferase involved in cell wall biosynthesis
VLQLLAWFQSSAMAARDLRLTIAGSGPLADAVQQAAVHDERIEYLGYVSPDVFFPRLSVLVVPSIWNDPSPVVIREAYAFGVPVVGSKCGGIPELVRLVDDRLVFDPFRSESLGRAVGVALDPTLRPRFRERAIAAMDRFTEARVVSDMAAIYRSVADDARR